MSLVAFPATPLIHQQSWSTIPASPSNCLQGEVSLLLQTHFRRPRLVETLATAPSHKLMSSMGGNEAKSNTHLNIEFTRTIDHCTTTTCSWLGVSALSSSAKRLRKRPVILLAFWWHLSCRPILMPVSQVGRRSCCSWWMLPTYRIQRSDKRWIHFRMVQT